MGAVPPECLDRPILSSRAWLPPSSAHPGLSLYHEQNAFKVFFPVQFVDTHTFSVHSSTVHLEGNKDSNTNIKQKPGPGVRFNPEWTRLAAKIVQLYYLKINTNVVRNAANRETRQ